MLATATLLALILSVPTHPTITTRVATPARLTVGDRFQVTLVVTSPTGSIVSGPLSDSMGVFVVGDEQRDTRARAGWSETTYRLSVAGFETGTHRLPVFVFRVLAGSQSDTLRSDTASVSIASVLPAGMKDIHGLKPAERFPNYALWIVPGALLLLAALAWLTHRLLRRLRRGRAMARPPLPPWEEALNALDALPWSEWLAGGQVKRYYYALSEILKRYIERRFEFQAAEQTTTEMLAAMRLHRTPMRDEVGRFFARSDLVKYSKVVPPDEEARAAIDRVREFVHKTRPAESVPAAAPTAGVTPVTAAEGA